MERKGSIEDLVEELKNQNLHKKDFVVPAKLMSMQDGKLIVNNYDSDERLMKLLSELGISLADGTVLELNALDVLHGNISERLNIPKKYYNRLLLEKDKKLLDNNVSHWFKSKGNNLFLRTFINKEENKGYGRALLSDIYNVIDNYDVLLSCLEAVMESDLNLKIDEGGCDLSEKRMYVRFVLPEIEIQAPEILKNYKNPKGGDNVDNGIITGFVVSNSEVGHGRFSISPRVVVLKCNNGMVFKDDAFGKVHLGGKMDKYTQIEWSEETKSKNYQLIKSQVNDAIKKFTSEDFLMKKISELQGYAEQQLEYPFETVQNVTKSLSITDEKERSILDYFLRGGDNSALGVSQALAFFAHETDDADEAYDMEIAAIDILPKIKEFDKPVVNRSAQTQISLN